VISEDDTLEGGNIPDSQIEDQIFALNEAYGPAKLTFNLSNVTRVVNQDWFSNSSPQVGQQTEMKEALRQGGSADLNVYSVG
jgi:hypothetical protein